MKTKNKFGDDTKFVGLTCTHKTVGQMGVITLGPRLIDGADPGLDDSYVVNVRWDMETENIPGYINITHLQIETGRGPTIGTFGKRN